MPPVQDVSVADGIICTHCGESTDEWADINIANIINGADLDVRLCILCVGILSLLLDINLEDEPEGVFKVTEFGIIERLKRDNN